MMIRAPSHVGNDREPLPKSNPCTSSYIRLQATSAQHRINGLQDRRSSKKSPSQPLLRLVNVPESLGDHDPACKALEPSGRPCKVALAATADDPWCHRHRDEWLDLTTRWIRLQKEAEIVVVLGSESAKQKVLKLRLSVELRRQIRDQFYPCGEDTQDYIKWIVKLETDVRQLADSLLSMACLETQITFRLT
jgi:hypothetical protein